MGLTYKKQSLFDAPWGSVIVHACNAQGVWGSGIAKEFAERYPSSYELYRHHCHNHDPYEGETVYGAVMIDSNDKNEDHIIGCLFTSENYGSKKDDKETIKLNTVIALFDLLKYSGISEVYSNKFNSGLFGVPWEETESILKFVLNKFPNVDWIVCDPNLEEK